MWQQYSISKTSRLHRNLTDARKGTTAEHQESRKQKQDNRAREERSPHSATVPHCTESTSKTNTPIKLEWAFGFDKGIRNGVHSLTRGPNSEKAIFFPASNTGVIHMYNEEGLKAKAEKQVLLRGHINHISGVAISEDKEWIATADTGKNSLLIVWNRTEARRVKVYTNPHPMGVVSVDFTPDAKLIVTLSALIPEAYIIGRAPSQETSNYQNSTLQDALEATETSDAPQENENGLDADIYQGVAIWNWRDSGNAPLRVAVIATPDIQHEIRFNPWDVNELLTSGRRRVLFWYWHCEDVSFHFYSPALQSKTFKQKIGDITTSAFVPRSTKALSGTTDGDVVMWNLSLILDGLSRPDERRAVSILRLRDSCVTCLQTVQDRLIVAGFADGTVCFYDVQLRLVRCFEYLDAGQIKCVSFVGTAASNNSSAFPHLEGQATPSKNSAKLSHDWMDDAKRLPPFVVSTSKARILEIIPAGLSREDERCLKEAVITVFEGLDAAPTALVFHPFKPVLAVAGLTGFMRLWNTGNHAVLGNVWFDRLSPTAVAFSPNGTFLAIGFSNGTLKICEFKIPEDPSGSSQGLGGTKHWIVELFNTRESREAVTHCTFSEDSAHLAVAYADNIVCLFRYDCRMGNPQYPEEWTFAGKHCSHYRRICGLSFAHAQGEPTVMPIQQPAAAQQPLPTASPHLYSQGYPRLFSVGEDRVLIEYDVPNSFEHTGLLKRWSCVVQQRAFPAGCLALPSPPGETDTEVLVYSTEAKATVWSANCMACVKTASVAMGNGGVLRLALMQDWTQSAGTRNRFGPVLLGACKEQLLGIHQLPLDGNPFKSVCVAAHAGQIVALAASPPRDGCTTVFTCGGSDFTVLQWSVNHLAVDRAFQRGPPGEESVLERFPGGRTGNFYRAAKELFYYSQLRSQGEHTTRSRRLGGTVPIGELPNLLCALGEAPTQLELNNIFSECRESDGISFERFLELYLNQRASQPFQYSDVVTAFKQVSRGQDGEEMSPEALTKLLLTKGEAMTEDELSHCLEVLTGFPSLSALCSRGSLTGDFFARHVLQMEP